MEGPFSGRVGITVLAAAVIAAPFIALVYSAEAGLAVMAAALAATTVLLREALALVETPAQRWLRLAMAVNLSLAAACVALLIWLIVGG
jgi:hypothetical protein